MDCLQAQGHASQLPEVSETKTHSRTSTLYSLKSHFSPDFEVFFDTLVGQKLANKIPSYSHRGPSSLPSLILKPRFSTLSLYFFKQAWLVRSGFCGRNGHHKRRKEPASRDTFGSPGAPSPERVTCELLRGARPCPAGLSGPGRGARAAPADSGDTASGIHSAQ